MRYRQKNKNVLVLCGRCLRALRSSGETVYIGVIDNYWKTHSCMWCESLDEELYSAVFDTSDNED